MVLARWTYSTEEWKDFLRSAQKDHSLFKRLGNLFMSKWVRAAPVVRITPEGVWIGKDHRHFSNDKHILKDIHIHEAATSHIIAITYGKEVSRGISSGEIRIPVPKGKLREAIEVEEKLREVRKAIQRG